MIRVMGEPDLARDENGVIHNTNQGDFHSFLAKRQAALRNKERIDKLEKDTAEIKDTLSLILQMLKEKQ